MTNELFEKELIEVLAELREESIIEVTIVFTRKMWDYDIINYEPKFSQFVFEKMEERIKEIIEGNNQNLCDNTSIEFWNWVKNEDYNSLNWSTEEDYNNLRYTINRDYYF